jgi:hypothetical protein
MVGAVLLAFLGPSGVALSANEACFDSYERTQRLRKDGKLVEASDQAAICAADSCPGMIKTDCARWKNEISKATPTVVFAAEDDQGKDVTGTTVFVDDRKVADSIDGKPVPLDPGPHRVRFESGDRKTEVTVELAAGDSNRRVAGTLAPPPPPPPPPSTHRRIPTVSLVLGGAAAVGLVSFVSFAIAGRVQQGCSPMCQPGQISAMRTEYAIADVSWITGLAALGGGVAFWIAQPSTTHSAPPADAPPPQAVTLRLEASPERGGATFGLRGSF